MAVEQLQKFTNNATTTVPGATTSGATSIMVATGTGSLFPVLSGSLFFVATLVNTVPSDPGFGQLEIVKVTARSGDVMTVVRGQEGTTPANFPAGVLFELRPTAQAFDNIYTEVVELETTKAPIDSPIFTGNPQAPTPSPGDNDTSLATTAFVTAAVAVATGKLINIQVFTASGTWTKPAGCTAAFVEVVGGGGGGGGAPATNASQVSCGSGGGGGGYTAEWITSGLGATETVTVGAGGAGVSGANGTAGTASSFGAHLTANGGSGGFANGPSGGMFVASGGIAGGSSGGNLLSTGSAGHIGLADFASQSTYGGNGGNTAKGGGGSGVVASSNGVGASANTGGGGGGASNRLSQSGRPGGNGASGVVIVYSYT